MKSLVEYIKEKMENTKATLLEQVDSEFIWTLYDEDDGTIVNVFDNEEAANNALKEYNNQSEDNKGKLKKEERKTIEKGN